MAGLNDVLQGQWHAKWLLVLAILSIFTVALEGFHYLIYGIAVAALILVGSFYSFMFGAVYYRNIAQFSIQFIPYFSCLVAGICLVLDEPLVHALLIIAALSVFGLVGGRFSVLFGKNGTC
jgi:hypothetical protein